MSYTVGIFRTTLISEPVIYNPWHFCFALLSILCTNINMRVSTCFRHVYKTSESLNWHIILLRLFQSYCNNQINLCFSLLTGVQPLTASYLYVNSLMVFWDHSTKIVCEQHAGCVSFKLFANHQFCYRNLERIWKA